MADKPKLFILDVDGVMTTGRFFYTADGGKIMKEFGADDNDGLSLVKPYLENGIRFVTGDKKGFPIVEKRIAEHMKYQLDLVSTTKRIDWIKEFADPKDVVYMGDGIFDHYVFKEVGYSIATSGALPHVQQRADFVCTRDGADRAIAEACLHLLEKFFVAYDPDAPLRTDVSYSGQWNA